MVIILRIMPRNPVTTVFAIPRKSCITKLSLDAASIAGPGTGIGTGANGSVEFLRYNPLAWHIERPNMLHCPPMRNFSATAGQASSELVYQGPLTTMVKGIKFFSLSTSVMSAAIIPVLLTHGNPGAMTTIGVSFGALMLATPAVLHWLSRSYVTKLYFDKERDSYTANTVTFILREATHTFKAEDVFVPPVRNVFTSFVANKRPFLVDPRGFSDVHHLNVLMGRGESLTQEDIDQIMKKMKEDED